MDARLISFGLIEIDGRRFEHDVVVEGGVVRRRKKAASKAYRDRYGHTPLSSDDPLVVASADHRDGSLQVMHASRMHPADRP